MRNLPCRRLLVTGASGFIGRRILAIAGARGEEKLEYDYIFTARRAQEIAGRRVHALDFDLLNDSELAAFMHEHRPTHLLHIAWYTGDKFYQSLENMTWLAHSARLFRAFLEAGGHAIASAGSCAEYAASGVEIFENASTSNATLYASAKNALRNLQSAACDQFGARSAWGRLSFVYGPDEPDRKLLRSTAAKLVDGEPVTIRESNKRADFLHVLDAARGLLLLAESDDAEGVYNIGSSQAPTLGTIVLQLRDLCGSASPITMGDAATADVLLNCARARAIGFEPDITFDDGLAEVAAAAQKACRS